LKKEFRPALEKCVIITMKRASSFMCFSGTAVLETEGSEHRISTGSGIEVVPGVQHKFLNKSDQDVVLLVISAPSTTADRIDVE
jgi:quercetin dioxygenase-like cupin family protein